MAELSDNAASDAHTWLRRAVAADAAGDVTTAEHAFLQALARDADLVDARFGLGVTYFRSARYGDAARELRVVVMAGSTEAVTCILLAKSLYLIGQFSESCGAFAVALRSAPLQGDSLRCYARARTYAAMIDGRIPAALADYPSVAGAEAEPIETVIRDGFGMLSAYGHLDAAAVLGELLIVARPDDAVQRHLNDAVAGRAIEHVPPAYVETHFDAFADGFDDKLVGVLNYRVPEHLAGLIAAHTTSFANMLDLGCGTGLAGLQLRRFGGALTGVDLSTKMLAHAEQRGVYGELVHAEAVAYLAAHVRTFDLVFAADTLIYFGRLEALMAAVAEAMVSGGIFAASIETADRGFALLPSGRFAHAEAYVTGLAAPHFDLLVRHPTEIRLEANRPAPGMLMVWRRR